MIDIRSHEAAGDLITAHDLIVGAGTALEAARRLGRWKDPQARGDDVARNSLRALQATLDRARRRLERLVLAATGTSRGEPLKLVIDERIKR